MNEEGVAHSRQKRPAGWVGGADTVPQVVQEMERVGEDAQPFAEYRAQLVAVGDGIVGVKEGRSFLRKSVVSILLQEMGLQQMGVRWLDVGDSIDPCLYASEHQRRRRLVQTLRLGENRTSDFSILARHVELRREELLLVFPHVLRRPERVVALQNASRRSGKERIVDLAPSVRVVKVQAFQQRRSQQPAAVAAPIAQVSKPALLLPRGPEVSSLLMEHAVVRLPPAMTARSLH